MITVRSNGLSIAISLVQSSAVSVPLCLMSFLRNFSGGNANHRTVCFHRIHYHGVRAHGDVVSQADAAEDLRTGAEYDIVSDIGTESDIKRQIHSLGTEGYALQDGCVPPDTPGSNHRPRRVRKEDSRSYFATRSNFEPKKHDVEIRQ